MFWWSYGTIHTVSHNLLAVTPTTSIADCNWPYLFYIFFNHTFHGGPVSGEGAIKKLIAQYCEGYFSSNPPRICQPEINARHGNILLIQAAALLPARYFWTGIVIHQLLEDSLYDVCLSKLKWATICHAALAELSAVWDADWSVSAVGKWFGQWINYLVCIFLDLLYICIFCEPAGGLKIVDQHHLSGSFITALFFSSFIFSHRGKYTDMAS